jgi:hypothetical protein
MGIEEMFRDCKTGGYNLEGTGLTEDRLIKMIFLMTIAYSRNILEGCSQKKEFTKVCLSPQRAKKKLSQT